MESTAPDLSVREVLRAPTTTEFAGVEAFARRDEERVAGDLVLRSLDGDGTSAAAIVGFRTPTARASATTTQTTGGIRF